METDHWGKEHFQRPWKMGKLARPDVKDEHDFYRYLVRFGMYEPSEKALQLFNELKKENTWEKVEKIYHKYKRKWKGPVVNIYIFPINQGNPFFIKQLQGRAGLTFQDSIFLFIAAGLEEKQLESLFVHEYHHAARMNSFVKRVNEYSLLDSLLFEGLAESAVFNNCGKEYTAYWTTAFSEHQLKKMLIKKYKPFFHIKRNDPKHDYLLFGGKMGIPSMFGYALGYRIVKGYIHENKITMKDSFSILSEKLLENNPFIKE